MIYLRQCQQIRERGDDVVHLRDEFVDNDLVLLCWRRLGYDVGDVRTWRQALAATVGHEECDPLQGERGAEYGLGARQLLTAVIVRDSRRRTTASGFPQVAVEVEPAAPKNDFTWCGSVRGSCTWRTWVRAARRARRHPGEKPQHQSRPAWTNRHRSDRSASAQTDEIARFTLSCGCHTSSRRVAYGFLTLWEIAFSLADHALDEASPLR